MRTVDDEGRVECSLCGEGIYIWNFYCLPVKEGDPVSKIWYEKDGKLWGRPKAFCKKCNSLSTYPDRKERQARHKKACAARRAKRIDTPEIGRAHV